MAHNPKLIRVGHVNFVLTFFFPPYSVFFFFSSTLGTKLMARETSLLEEKIVTIVCETRKDNSKIIIIRLNLLYVSYFVFLRINTRKLDLFAHLFFYKQFLTLKRRKLSPFLWFSPSKILDFNFTTLSNSSSIYLFIRGWKKKKTNRIFWYDPTRMNHHESRYLFEWKWSLNIIIGNYIHIERITG